MTLLPIPASQATISFLLLDPSIVVIGLMLLRSGRNRPYFTVVVAVRARTSPSSDCWVQRTRGGGNAPAPRSSNGRSGAGDRRLATLVGRVAGVRLVEVHRDLLAP